MNICSSVRGCFPSFNYKNIHVVRSCLSFVNNHKIWALFVGTVVFVVCPLIYRHFYSKKISPISPSQSATEEDPKSLKEKLENTQQEITELRQSKESEISKLKDDLDRLQRELQLKSTELASVKSQLEQQTEAIAELKKSKDAEITQAQKCLEQSTNDLSLLKTSLEEATHRTRVMENEIANLQKKLADKEEKITQLINSQTEGIPQGKEEKKILPAVITMAERIAKTVVESGVGEALINRCSAEIFAEEPQTNRDQKGSHRLATKVIENTALLALIKAEQSIEWESLRDVDALFKHDSSKEILKQINDLLQTSKLYQYIRQEFSKLSLEEISKAQVSIKEHNQSFSNMNNNLGWQAPEGWSSYLYYILEDCLSNIIIEKLETQLDEACKSNNQELMLQLGKKLNGLDRPKQRTPFQDDSLYKDCDANTIPKEYSVINDFLAIRSTYEKEVYEYMLQQFNFTQKSFGFKCIFWATVIKYNNECLIGVVKGSYQEEKFKSLSAKEKPHDQGYIKLLFRAIEEQLSTNNFGTFLDLFTKYFQTENLNTDCFAYVPSNRDAYPELYKLALEILMKPSQYLSNDETITMP